jgi:tetratricopeptide (TPR) repeat protein
MNWLQSNGLRVGNGNTNGAARVALQSCRASVLAFLFSFAWVAGDAQTNAFIKQGNKLYEQMKYDEAAANYAKALQKNPTYTPGLFNLGNTLYQQKKYDESRKVMEQTAKVAGDKDSKSAANYNVGNTFMSQQKWEDAIASYKHSLRNNPQDADAKYNLSYAEQMLKKQNQDNKNNKNNKQNKQNKDQQKKDKQDQKKDQDKKNQDKQDQGQNDQDKEDQEKDQKPEGQPSKLSQQQAEQLLNALQQEEKKLQDKMKKEKGVPVKMQRDW